jgi:hypothetical protein
LTGGIGYNATIPIATTTTNSLFVGTYSGSIQPVYTTTSSGGTVSTPGAIGKVTTLSLAPDSTTGGYDLAASGTTTDPSGNAVSFTMTSTAVDPCGIIADPANASSPALTVTYTYANGNAPVTNTYTTAYLNLGETAATSLTGILGATTTGWSGSPAETDTLVLTQTSAAAKKGAATPKRK